MRTMSGRVRTAALTAGLTTSIALASNAAPQTATTFCEGLAARIRTSKDVSAGATDILSFTTRGPSPYVQLAAPDEKGLSLDRDPAAPDRVQLEKRIRTRFGNADALLKELRNWDFFDVMTLPGSDAHMVLTTGGTAACEARLFFRTTVSRDVSLIPDPPAKSDHDATNAICENLGGWGYLARINGVDAFLEYRAVDRRESFRIVPLTNGGWQAPCTITAQYKTNHGVTQVYVPKDPPVAEGVFRSLVAPLLERRDEAGDPKLFTFGPPVPERDAVLVKTMMDLASAMPTGPIAGFGKDSELPYTSLDYGESHPIVIDQQTYLMRIGVGRTGCCFVSDPILMFYKLTNGRLEPIASVFTASARGPLQRLDVEASR